MTVRRPALPLMALTLAVVLGACGSDGPTPDASASSPTIGNLATLVPTVTPQSASKGGTSPTATPPGGASTASPTAAPTDPGASPAPLPPGSFEDVVPVEAVITPACVVRGSVAKITVYTGPKNAVAYHAIYAGTKGGAPPPFGYGYGGDNRGHANGEGVYTSTWVVRFDAPVGPARADVIAADGQNFGYDDPGFYVAANSAGCPG